MDIFSYKLGQKRGGGSGGGGSVRLQNKTFNANGTYTADAGYDGLGTVKVAVPEEEAVLQDKTITANGTYTADAEYDGLGTVRVDVEAKLQDKTATDNGSYTADSGFDGLGTVIVSVPEKEAVLEDKTITENGTYTAAAGYDGLGTVTVDVAGGGSDEDWIIGDGNTHLWISLPEGRTSPMLGVGVSGTVTVDWGDGTAPDVLTGTNTRTAVYTPNHAYGEAGDYVVTLSGDGEIGFVGNYSGTYLLSEFSTASDTRNRVYRTSIRKIECGNKVKAIGNYSFADCLSLASVVIPDGVTSIGEHAFFDCFSLASVVIPDGVTKIIEYAFNCCYSLTSIVIGNGVTSIGNYSFSSCFSLASVVIPDGVTSIGNNVFAECRSLTSVVIPDKVTSIGNNAFKSCYSLASIVIGNGVTSIGNNAFVGCTSMRCYDFSKHTVVPTLANIDAFTNIPADCEIRVPAALADEWKAATNWSTYADYIVGV